MPPLPDSVWLNILRLVSAESSLQLSDIIDSEASPAVLRRVAKDWRLWTNVTVVNVDNRAQLRRIIPRLGRRTETIAISGSKRRKRKSDGFLLDSFLESVRLRCTTLRSVRLEGLLIDAHCSLALPKSVHHLSLVGTEFDGLPKTRCVTASPFYNLHRRLPNLSAVRLSTSSKWMTKVDLSLLNKSPLRLRVTFD